MNDKFDERLSKIIKDFSKSVIPNEKSAKLAEELFMLIGELRGEIKGLELRLNSFIIGERK